MHFKETEKVCCYKFSKVNALRERSLSLFSTAFYFYLYLPLQYEGAPIQGFPGRGQSQVFPGDALVNKKGIAGDKIRGDQ